MSGFVSRIDGGQTVQRVVSLKPGKDSPTRTHTIQPILCDPVDVLGNM